MPRTPRLINGKPGIAFELQVTYRCNAVCKFCNRLVGVLPAGDRDMTPEDAREAVRKLRTAPFSIYRCKVTGGEPALNEHLSEILHIFAPIVHGPGRVLTNATRPKHRASVELPPGWRWRRSGLDDMSDMRSGKSYHEPFLISPRDLRIEGEPPCDVLGRCGRVYEKEGFTFCGVAGSLGRLLDIPVHSSEPVLDPDPRVCQHCIHSIHRPIRDGIFEMQRQGHLPAVTPTFAAALNRCNVPQQAQRELLEIDGPETCAPSTCR